MLNRASRLRRVPGFVAPFIAGILLSGCGGADKGMDPMAHVAAGWARFRLADYRPALEQFDLALASAGAGDPARAAALYGKAVTWDLRQPVPSQDDALAAEFYRKVIAEAPDSDLAAWSRLALARMTHLVPVGEEPDYEKVRAAYQDVIDRHPAHMAGHEALIYQQSTLIMTLEPGPTRDALARLQSFLAAYPDSPFASAAWNLIAQGHETLGEHAQQLDARLRELERLEIDPDSPAAADLSWRYWQIAATAEFLAGRFDVARVYYQKLIDEYPLDFRKFPAKQALARMDTMEKTLREGGAP